MEREDELIELLAGIRQSVEGVKSDIMMYSNEVDLSTVEALLQQILEELRKEK